MKNDIKFVQDVDATISVMKDAGEWLLSSGKHPSKWWKPDNMDRDFLLQHADTDQFYTGIVDKKSVVGAILQFDQRNQDWGVVDGEKSPDALYIHWLCVRRGYEKKGYPKQMIDFAAKIAREKDIKYLRADTNADETKLRNVYEDLGFKLIKIIQEDYRKTAYYQKMI
ncbi:MAG TPA: GNAT family N-acetyltransferase [Patescibacteria group bacterium]|nr:GNAT family N-acetyltransferase [Patescibacteria group bacterium]